jgi:hypothetical protein
MRKIFNDINAVGRVDPGVDAETGSLPLPLTSTETPIAPPTEYWLQYRALLIIGLALVS